MAAQRADSISKTRKGAEPEVQVQVLIQVLVLVLVLVLAQVLILAQVLVQIQVQILVPVQVLVLVPILVLVLVQVPAPPKPNRSDRITHGSDFAAVSCPTGLRWGARMNHSIRSGK